METKQTSFQRLSMSDLSNPSTLSEDLSISLAGSNIHIFTLPELKVITQNFASSNFLGEGGFGPVHKGFIDDKLRPGLKAQPVAVKFLDLDGSQGHREWLAEVIFLGRTSYSEDIRYHYRGKACHLSRFQSFQHFVGLGLHAETFRFRTRKRWS
ncbi:hypothetical protein OIU84_010729 [Salix udensis]|uniref:Uncharacterized protein n=1 Tax=Salix udensis TaxID=889485 RepID=A0AAD6JM30_9ROSI|nr:hypothetical protein OIU84_010729 [Salix udensis]